MIPAEFEYARATSVEHAVELLAGNDDAKALAGGHSLIPLLRLRVARPELLVDVGRLDDLRYVREDDGHVAIGALGRHADLARDPVLRAHCAVVADAAGGIGDPQVRHRGTIGGSVAHGDPASDLGTVLLTIGAEFVAQGPGGTRTVGADDLFTGLFTTALARDELLTEIRVPKVSSAFYLKHVRRAQDWATVGVAAARLDDGLHVGLTNMGMAPLHARGVEEALAGGATAAAAAERTAEGTDPPSDATASSDYRTHIAQVLVRRALERL
jgi:aerobic carbon-monoxide dehydrogenase medium subunit